MRGEGRLAASGLGAFHVVAISSRALAWKSLHHHDHAQLLRWQGLPLPRRTPEDARKELEDEYLAYRLEGEAADVAKCGVDLEELYAECQ